MNIKFTYRVHDPNYYTVTHASRLAIILACPLLWWPRNVQRVFGCLFGHWLDHTDQWRVSLNECWHLICGFVETRIPDKELIKVGCIDKRVMRSIKHLFLTFILCLLIDVAYNEIWMNSFYIRHVDIWYDRVLIDR